MKKHTLKLLSFATATITMLGIFPTFAMEKSAYPSSIKFQSTQSISLGKIGKTPILTKEKLSVGIASDSKTNSAFCMERPFYKAPNGGNYAYSSEAGAFYQYVLTNGYPNKTYSELGLNNKEEAIYATQMAIWSYIEGWGMASFTANNPKIVEVTTSLFNGGMAAKSNPKSTTATINKTNAVGVLTDSNKNFHAGDFQILTNNSLFTHDYSVSLSDTSFGAKVVNATTGAEQSSFNGNESFAIKVPSNASKQSVDFTVTGKVNELVAVKYNRPAKDYQDLVKLEYKPTGFTFTGTANWNTPVGELEVTKTDEAGNKLSGAEFSVKNSSGTEVVKGTTNDSGIVKFPSLPLGSYTYEEILAPKGYIINSTKFPFEIKANGEIVKATMVNSRQTGSIEITKTDEAGNKLSGAEFSVQNSDGIEVARGKTDENGVARFSSLPTGSYVYEEVLAPQGYVINSNKFPFEIKANGEVVKATMVNKRIEGILELTKADVSTGELLPNAEFIIRDETGNEVVKGKTDESGIAKFTLNYGKYTYQEFNAPEGYVIDESEFPFEIKEDGEIVKATMTNKMIEGEVSILKIDSITKKPLQGADFTIYDEAGVEIKTVTTGEDGVAKFKLSFGKYTIKETKAPNGYVLVSDIFNVDIVEDNKVIEIVVENTMISGNLEILKLDADSKKIIPGVEFVVMNEDGDVIKELVTGEDGKAVLNLPFGKYFVKESKALPGYILSEEIVEFEIKDNDYVVSVTIYNKKFTGSAKVLKVDSKDDNLVLEGAEFTLYSSDDKALDTKTTDNSGNILFEGLTYGEFYIKETKAPYGYELNDKKQTFEITEEGQMVELKFENKKIEQILPEAGGLGTIVLVGSGLCVLAGIYLVLKKKRK